MTRFNFIWYYLWAAPHALQLIIVWAMMRRRLQVQFPAFFSYIIFEILQFAVLAGISWSHLHFGDTYLRAYAAGLGLSTVFRFGVIHEVLTGLFRSYPALSRPGTLLFRGVTLLLLLIVMTMAINSSGNSSGTFIFIVHALDRGASILQCGLLLTLFFLSRYLDLPWRSPMFGIALGVGIVASVGLVIAAIRTQLGISGRVALDFTTMATYHCCVVLWLFYLLVPERRPQLVTELPQTDLEVWNNELESLLRR
jgi:hypothetical protein